ncbi:MAG: type II toxin-antitoxin system VapC family toxin [Actinomycetota bacterium]
MLLPDSSAWVELLRDTDSAVHRRLREALETGEPVGISEPVMLEVLSGARSQEHASALRSQLIGFELLSVGGLAGFDRAAAIYRTCRDAGETLRGTIDCLIAVAAMRSGATLLHSDRDFDVIARHTDLQVEPAG